MKIFVHNDMSMNTIGTRRAVPNGESLFASTFVRTGRDLSTNSNKFLFLEEINHTISQRRSTVQVDNPGTGTPCPYIIYFT
jgi:hypothetical protein